MLLQELPSTQQHIALAYIKQKADISKKAYESEMQEAYRHANRRFHSPRSIARRLSRSPVGLWRTLPLNFAYMSAFQLSHI
jgi:hypothetical protein